MFDHIGTYYVPYVDDNGILQHRDETVLVLRNGSYVRFLSDEEKKAWGEESLGKERENENDFN